MASTDFLRKGFYGSATTLSAGISNSATTIPLSSTVGLPTDSGIDIVIDRVDANGTLTPSKQETVTVQISGSNGTTAIRGVEGSAQAHSSGAVVEVLFTAATHNDHIRHNLVHSAQDGTLLATGGSLTTPKIITSINDTNNNEFLKLTPTPSAVNEITYANAATGNSPTLTASGDDTNVGFSIRSKGTGKINIPELQFSGAKVYNNAVQAITDSTETTVTFNQEAYDTDAYHDTVTNTGRLTVTTPGYYQVGFQYQFASWDTTTARRMYAMIRKNATTSYTMTDFTLTSSGPDWSATLDLLLAATDYVELRVFQNTTATRNLNSGENVTAFWIKRLGI